jgi:hypothetical protein
MTRRSLARTVIGGSIAAAAAPACAAGEPVSRRANWRLAAGLRYRAHRQRRAGGLEDGSR